MESFKERLSFSGGINVDGDVVPAFRVEIERQKYDCNAEIKFTAYLASEDVNKLDGLLRGKVSVILSGLLYKDPIVVDAFWSNFSDRRLTGTIGSFLIGGGKLSSRPIRQMIIVKFSPNDVVLSDAWHTVRNSDGTIEIAEGSDKRPPFEIDAEIGIARLSLQYDYEDSNVDEAKITAMVPVPSLLIEVNETCIDENVDALINRCTQAIEPIETMVSFLGRRQFRWNEILVLSEQKDMPVSEVRRVKDGFASKKPLARLIVPQRLDANSIDGLISNYLGLPFCEAVCHTIGYLNSYWGDGFLESSAMMSFTAFETLINGISRSEGTDLIVSDEVFKVVKRKVQSHVRDVCDSLGVGKSEKCEMYAKLGELQRSPIVPRAVTILERYEIKWNDLDLNSETLRDWLRGAYKRRSALLHSGHIENNKQAMIDTRCIHALTERLVYKLVGGNEKWIDRSAYPRVKH